jgi:serine carboxypeptidase-like clade 2
VDVQTAIHAKKGTNWQVCNLVLNEEYVRDDSVLYIYPYLLNKGYRVLIYSGDVDSSVNYKGTQMWLNTLDLQVQVKEFCE